MEKEMNRLYREIAETVNEMIPEEWKEIFLYAEFREGYKKVFFYYYSEIEGEPVYSLDITDIFNVDDAEFDGLEKELYNCFSRLLEEFKEQNQKIWTSLTFILDNTGKMKINYGYENISDLSPVEKQDKWEAEYLKKKTR